MTPEQDINETIRRRRAARAEQRRRAEQERKKLMLRLGAVGVVVVLVVIVVVAFSLHAGSGPVSPTEKTQPPVLQTEQPETNPPAIPTTEPETTGETAPPEFTVIHIAAAGDLNVTDQVISNSLTPNGHDFTATFQDVASVLGQADLTVLNFEGTFAGAPYGGEASSAPMQLAATLKQIGVDAVQTANSASIRGGILGLQSTIDTLYQAGIMPVGTFYDSKDFQSSGGYRILDVQGVRVALVGFTKGMDNLGLPAGSEDCVNLLYEDYTTDYKKVDTAGIRKVLRRVEEEQPDLTIAMLHWGSEYNEDISSSQKDIRDLMLSNGVDIILGTHPHLVQTVELDRNANTLVAYSLGDFFGDADQPGTNYSLVLDIEVVRDNVTGEVTIEGFTYTPIYTVRPEDSAAGGHRVVRIQQALSRYEGNYLGRINEDTYDSMEYALKRVSERVTQKVE